jgi:hypothetical protein
MLRARVCDPLGPRWLRALIPAFAILLLILPLFAPGLFAPGDESARLTASLLGAALFFGRRLIQPRFPDRDATVEVAAGSIAIAQAGALSQTINASDVVAASTARTAEGVALALVRRGATERPLVLDFAAEEELDAVRRALGLGHFGFGTVGWPTRARSTALQGSTILAVAWLAIAASSAFELTLLGFTLALVVLPATVVALLVACLQDPHGPRVALTGAGVKFSDQPVWAPPLRYADVLGASVEPEGVMLRMADGPLMVPLNRSLAHEREHFAAQVLSAAARARGEGPPPPIVPPPLARLAPRGETERDWLERLDAAAASIASSDAYRGSDLDPRDLWVALESPDAPARVRAAAARVLCRVAPEEARARVADVLACDRDAHTRACIRSALEDDVDTAARELETLKAHHPEG